MITSNFKKWLAIPLALTMLIAPTASAYTLSSGGGGNDDGPQIVDHYVDYDGGKSYYNPEDDGNITIRYELDDAPANIEIEIYNNDINYQEQLQGLEFEYIGWHSVKWDGKIGSSFAPEDIYKYRIEAHGADGDDVVIGSLRVDYDGNFSNDDDDDDDDDDDAPNITDDDVDPGTFNPDDEDAEISYRLNVTADVRVKIFDGSQEIVELLDKEQDDGEHTVDWDGRDEDNDKVDEGTYTYEIFAENNDGEDTETGTVKVDYDDDDDDDDDDSKPKITDHYTEVDGDDEDEFEVGEESIRIYYTIDKDAEITVEILDGSKVIRELLDRKDKNDGTHSVLWNGRDDDGDYVDEDDYTYRIEAENNFGKDTEEGDIEATDGSGSNSDDLISGVTVDEPYFDPEDGEKAELIFDVDENNVDISIHILDDRGRVIDTIISRHEYDRSNNNTIRWNGRDDDNDIVDDDIYEFRIKAEKGNDDQIEYEDIEVDTDGTTFGNNARDDIGDLIRDVYIDDEVFDPTDGDRARLYFDVEEDNVDITVEVFDGNTRILTIVDDKDYDEGDNFFVSWNGRDRFNKRVADDVYTMRIEAEKGSKDEEAERNVEVDTDGIRSDSIGFNSSGNCGGFQDVPLNSPLCNAIGFVKQNGIFDGYSDGSFRPYDPINRAEASKVILLALGKSIQSDDNSTLGFIDLIRNEWYIPYIKTGQVLGILSGYPDRTFRPNLTINRVELLKVFLRTAGVSVANCNIAPYADTPITNETRWYINDVCHAKTYGLMFADIGGMFNPSKPMTRGDVAELFYRFYGNN